ncbi:unnamed protein product [Pleuronectes platessa]|uniref:Uncharacterized protein n=1 Tax=Pleuronectes platessa TaxID=8262 RepID=A0A9N7TMK3_PLEPL|nr:unnamed protein product [Pleuronectes platessa]
MSSQSAARPSAPRIWLHWERLGRAITIPPRREWKVLSWKERRGGGARMDGWMLHSSTLFHSFSDAPRTVECAARLGGSCVISILSLPGRRRVKNGVGNRRCVGASPGFIRRDPRSWSRLSHPSVGKMAPQIYR